MIITPVLFLDAKLVVAFPLCSRAVMYFLKKKNLIGFLNFQRNFNNTFCESLLNTYCNFHVRRCCPNNPFGRRIPSWQRCKSPTCTGIGLFDMFSLDKNSRLTRLNSLLHRRTRNTQKYTSLMKHKEIVRLKQYYLVDFSSFVHKKVLSILLIL